MFPDAGAAEPVATAEPGSERGWLIPALAGLVVVVAAAAALVLVRRRRAARPPAAT
jgi:LPXTG-motif cell wall-anchored protein